MEEWLRGMQEEGTRTGGEPRGGEGRVGGTEEKERGRKDV